MAENGAQYHHSN